MSERSRWTDPDDGTRRERAAVRRAQELGEIDDPREWRRAHGYSPSLPSVGSPLSQATRVASGPGRFVADPFDWSVSELIGSLTPVADDDLVDVTEYATLSCLPHADDLLAVWQGARLNAAGTRIDHDYYRGKGTTGGSTRGVARGLTDSTGVRKAFAMFLPDGEHSASDHPEVALKVWSLVLPRGDVRDLVRRGKVSWQRGTLLLTDRRLVAAVAGSRWEHVEVSVGHRPSACGVWSRVLGTVPAPWFATAEHVVHVASLAQWPGRSTPHPAYVETGWNRAVVQAPEVEPVVVSGDGRRRIKSDAELAAAQEARTLARRQRAGLV